MKLLVFSDIHSDHRALERLVAMEADWYVAAGDLVSWSRGLDRCGEILKTRGDRVLVLPGNHESASQIEAFCAKYGLRNFHGETMQLGRFHVAGLGYSSPTPFNTPGEYSEKEIASRLAAFAELEPLVLICHCPPYATALDRVKEGVHAGSRSVAEFIEKRQPEWFCCGHIHEAEGVETRLGKTRAVNVGKRGYSIEI